MISWFVQYFYLIRVSNLKHKEMFFGSSMYPDQVKSPDFSRFTKVTKSQSLNVTDPCQFFSGNVHSNIVYTE